MGFHAGYGRRVVCAFLGCMLVWSGTARADNGSLPWLADPFRTQTKANNMVSPALKPEVCPASPNLKHKLDFMEVVTMTLCHNPATRAAYLTLLAQAATYGTNYSSYLPSIAATVNNSRTTTFINNSNSATTTVLSDGTLITGSSGFGKFTSVSKSYGAQASLMLYDFGQREFKLEVAEQALIAAGYSYDSTLQGTIASAMQAYSQLLTAQNNIGVTRELERYSKASYDAAAMRHRVGDAPLSDVLQAKGTYSQAQLSNEQAVNQLAQDQAALALLMGLPADSPVMVADVDDRLLMHDPFQMKVHELMEEAKQKRDDLLASRAQIEGARASLQALKRSDLATVSVTTNLGLSNNTISIYRGVGATRSQGIGLSVNIPIFTGFQQTYNERSVEDQLEAQEDQFVKSELGVEQDVWNAWHNYDTAKRSWDTSWDLLTSARQLKDVALGRYKEGLGTILDVLNAESQYSSALQSQLQSRYSLLTARVDLVRAVGVLDLDTVQPKASIAEPASRTGE